jgi:hypothetical protein
MTSTLSTADTVPHREVVVRTPRRHAVVLSGGVAGVSRVAGALIAFGCRVCDLAVEVHDGVGLSNLTCTVATTPAEADHLADRLRSVPGVVAVDAC